MERNSTKIIEDMLKISGITSVIIAHRDGVVIESAGNTSALNLDDLGASLTHAVGCVEEMGHELHVGQMADMFVEYKGMVIVCKPVGSAIAALLTCDTSRLGIIRHKSQPLFNELDEQYSTESQS